jgi:hypothetical protein
VGSRGHRRRRSLGFTPIVKRLDQRIQAFQRPVLLLEGDSHGFKVDHPLANPDRDGSLLYGARLTVPNLTRIVVQGSTSEPHEWLRLRSATGAAPPGGLALPKATAPSEDVQIMDRRDPSPRSDFLEFQCQAEVRSTFLTRPHLHHDVRS